MDEVVIDREMDTAVAKALGWYIEYRDADPLLGRLAHDHWCTHGGWGMYAVDEWRPWTSDADALVALDIVLAKPEYQQVCVEIGNLVGAKGTSGWLMRLHFSPEKRLPYIERLGKSRAEAICRAIMELAEVRTPRIADIPVISCADVPNGEAYLVDIRTPDGEMRGVKIENMAMGAGMND